MDPSPDDPRTRRAKAVWRTPKALRKSTWFDAWRLICDDRCTHACMHACMRAARHAPTSVSRCVRVKGSRAQIQVERTDPEFESLLSYVIKQTPFGCLDCPWTEDFTWGSTHVISRHYGWCSVAVRSNRNPVWWETEQAGRAGALQSLVILVKRWARSVPLLPKPFDTNHW